MTNREINATIDRIKGLCEIPNRFVSIGNYFTCQRGFTLHYSGGSVEVKPGYHVSFYEDGIAVRATSRHEIDTSKPFKESLRSALAAGVEALGAKEHRIRWQTISGITVSEFGQTRREPEGSNVNLAIVDHPSTDQSHSCFISYSSHDQAFAERLHSDLSAKGLRCWFAPEDLKIGDRFQERIEESIMLYDRLMIVLSEASVQSRWVEREVNAAREREDRENRTVLFPIRIDDAVMKTPQPWAADIRRTRHVGDFRGWEGSASYTKAFERLLRDLNGPKI